jgi:hypothetical protein
MAVSRAAAALASLGLGMLLAGGALSWLLGSSDVNAQVSLTLGLLLVVVAGVKERAFVQETLQSRSFSYGSGSSLIVLLAGMLAVLAFVVAEKYDRSVDLTSDSRHSLSQQTISILGGLTEPVKLVAFYEADSAEQAAFHTMARRFQEHSSQLELQMVDPLREPLLAKKYEITSEYGAVILEAGERQRRLAGLPLEKQLAEALLLLFSDVEHQVCWSMGHGEPSPDDTQAPDGFGGIVTRLEGLNYTVTKSHVLTEGIDKKCELLLVVRPLLDWLPYEMEALAAYLAAGGQVFAALEPGMAPGFSASMRRYGLVVGEDVIVDVNPKNRLMGVDDSSFVVLTHDDVLAHPITQDLSAALVLGIARSVTPEAVPEGMKATRILETSEDAWAETAMENFPNVAPDEGELSGSVSVMVAVTVEDPSAISVAEVAGEVDRSQDIRRRLMEWFGAQFNREVDSLNDSLRFREDLGAGDRDIEAAIEAVEELFGKQLLADASLDSFQTIGDVAKALTGDAADSIAFEGNEELGVPADFAPAAGGRLVVIGDADFAGNRLMEFGNNQDLFLNTVAWLAKEERQIGERPTEGDKLALTGFGEGLICLVSVVFVPGGAVFMAVLLMARRRYL